jgi:hypothetical protein
MHYTRSPIHGAVFATVDEAVQWAGGIMEENHVRMGPFAKALIEPYSSPVSVIEVV